MAARIVKTGHRVDVKKKGLKQACRHADAEKLEGTEAVKQGKMVGRRGHTVCVLWHIRISPLLGVLEGSCLGLDKSRGLGIQDAINAAAPAAGALSAGLSSRRSCRSCAASLGCRQARLQARDAAGGRGSSSSCRCGGAASCVCCCRWGARLCLRLVARLGCCRVCPLLLLLGWLGVQAGSAQRAGRSAALALAAAALLQPGGQAGGVRHVAARQQLGLADLRGGSEQRRSASATDSSSRYPAAAAEKQQQPPGPTFPPCACTAGTQPAQLTCMPARQMGQRSSDRSAAPASANVASRRPRRRRQRAWSDSRCASEAASQRHSMKSMPSTRWACRPCSHLQSQRVGRRGMPGFSSEGQQAGARRPTGRSPAPSHCRGLTKHAGSGPG